MDLFCYESSRFLDDVLEIDEQGRIGYTTSWQYQRAATAHLPLEWWDEQVKYLLQQQQEALALEQEEQKKETKRRQKYGPCHPQCFGCQASKKKKRFKSN